MTVKKIAIFGATGRTGLTTLAQAVQAGMSWGRREMSRGDQAEHPERGIVRSGRGRLRPSVIWCVRTQGIKQVGDRGGGRCEIQFYVS